MSDVKGAASAAPSLDAVAKEYTLDDVVSAFDADGNHFRRKIRTGLRRGEFYVERGSKNGEPLLFQKATPTGLNLHNIETGQPVRHEIDPKFRLCWRLTEAAFAEASS